MIYLLKLLHLRRNEVPRLGLAAALFFLVQIDDGIVKSVASAVFNIRAGVENLPLMYTWIAVLFSLSMILLSWLTAKVARQRLLLGMMVGVALVFAVNAGMLFLQHSGYVVLAADYYSFLFVSSEIARTLMNFQIWIVAGGICYVSRAKVFFPLLASSAVLGDISGGFAVRFLGSLLESYQLYVLATLNMAVVIGLLRQLMRRYFVGQQGDESEAVSLGENLRYFTRSYYLLLLFGLSLVIFAAYTTVHYGFNVVAYDYFEAAGDPETKITEFFGLFFGLTGVATLFVTTFLLQRILRWIGTGNVYLWVGVVYVLIAVLLLGVFTDGLAGISGLEWTLVLVFLPVLAIFIGNLINFLLLDSVIAPTYQVLVKLVPARNSDGTRMIMEGGFMLLGGLFGAGITALHAHDILTMGELFALLLSMGFGMVVCGYFLKRSYTTELVKAVREQNFDVEDDQAMQALKGLLANDPDFSRGLLLHRNDGVRQMGIEMLRQSPGPAVEQVCLELFDHENVQIRAAAMEAFTLSSGGDASAATVAVLGRLGDDDGEDDLSGVKALARLIDEAELGDDDRAAIGATVVGHLTAESTVGMRAECLVVLTRLDHSESASQRDEVLNALLADDEEVEALIAGIGAAGRMGAVQAHTRLLECLSHQYPAVREATVHCLGALEQDEGLTALMGMLGDPDPDVVAAVVVVLGRAKGVKQRMVDELSQRPVKEWQGLLGALIAQDDEEGLNEALVASCRERLVQASRYLVAIDRLEKTGDPAVQLLVDQLRLQNSLVQDGVVRLLGYLGDVGVVGDLMERLGAADGEARESAIELLENIADRELLAQLMPLIESDCETQLAIAYEVSGWREVELDEVLEDLLHSPNVWTEMATIWATFSLGREAFVDVVAGELVQQAREIMEEIKSKRGDAAMAEDQPLTTMEKITFLKESPFFASLPLEELYHIALSMEEEGAREGVSVIKEGTMGDKMYIVVSGELEVKKEGGPRFAVLGESQVFGEQALLDEEPRSASVVALGDVHLLSLQRSSLERILRRYSSIAFNMMRILSQRLREAQNSRT
jgi:CRP/FNR family cyclic AMP-dependent transcriptional regulator